MIKGPLDFIPPIEIEIVENRKAIPLAENEGVYVRDTRTGEVKLVKGPITYLLS
jgi:major vault protein